MFSPYRSRRLWPAALVAATLTLPSLSATSPEAFLGEWVFVSEPSTDMSPWRSSRLTIAQSGSDLTLSRSWRGGRRTHTESTTLDLSRPVNHVPQTWWVDNRHLGAYSPADALKTVRHRLLDQGRVFRLETDLNLETQQGTRAVNIISQYQISPDGEVLTLTDLRSTRPRPVIHVFRRVSS